jgi:hypothetical protein
LARNVSLLGVTREENGRHFNNTVIPALRLSGSFSAPAGAHAQRGQEE